ncbi:RpiB/LacA/LacB family sugar-phosphate isomerase [Streptomyces sp. NBC_00582]|uniref:RpiB/LacA/LacB family sugar-phosphate isomerase n=1 Tax=Streptomyces sp. NBC_00582 TaxID=2975783 RepID=UPI0010643ADD|nr:RpiB/LacA/LacB family sugar-phosphate isomerase [Streptomyces sp. NBC_00582]WUB66742.1 RpiB/LacA/LacB family sugar-phosphate isomerase [Streptomyces sp. NBC_00582]
MRISVSSDMDEAVARALVSELRGRGHDVVTHGALRPGDDPQWAVCSEAAARDVADGISEQAVVCCWTGTGASIAANKVPGVRAALCADAYTADGARRWNDANVLALSLRVTSEPLLKEILDAWFGAEAGRDAEDRRNVEHLTTLDTARTAARPRPRP